MKSPMFVALLLAAGTAAAEPPRTLGVDDLVTLAVERDPRLRAGRERVRAAKLQASAAEGRLLPALRVTDDNQTYAAAYNREIQLNPAAPAIAFPIRDQNVNVLSVTAVQPLTGLLRGFADRDAAVESAGELASTVAAQEALVAEDVKVQLLRLFEARATAGIAQAARQQLAEQRTVAATRVEAGVWTAADVLRLDVAAANAFQQELQANAAAEVARANLLAHLGLSPDDPSVEFEEPLALLDDAPAETDLTHALESAARQRPELAASRHALAAASHRHDSALYRLVPELNVIAAYAHVAGQALSQPDAAWLGLRLDWTAWDWFSTWNGKLAAGALVDAAAADAEAVRQNVASELASRLSQQRTTTAALDVARTAIQSAEEQFRVTQTLVKAGSATTTDLLNSQSELTTARLNLVRARYAQAIARVAVRRASGG